VAIGATRQDASNYYFESISHYVYAGDSALHIAAAAYHHALAMELIAHGADPRVRNRRGAEPLHYAVDGIPGSSSWNPDTQAKIVDYLIEVGADPNAADKSDVTPLHRAVRNRCGAAVKVLLTRGADSRRRTAGGSTPLHLAVQNTGRGGSGSSSAREEQRQIIQELLCHGARSSDTDARGKTVRQSVTSEWIHELLPDD
jgi:ankyrin repeat protein